jgi:hypothetical protein
MNPLSDRLGRERHTMAKMVEIYCNARHKHARPALCAECQGFLDYAEARLDKCPYGADKPTCANCPIHCYKPGPRARAKMIMRYSGPRMLLRHPYLTITHKLDGFIAARHPKELTRVERSQMRER